VLSLKNFELVDDLSACWNDFKTLKRKHHIVSLVYWEGAKNKYESITTPRLFTEAKTTIDATPLLVF
jgi:hypothetical protein